MKKAIVCYSHVVGLAVIRALGRMGVPVIALHHRDSEMGDVSKYVQERIRVPNVRTDEESFISKIIDIADRYKGSLLIPTDDFTVVALSRYKSQLENFYTVAVGDWNLTGKMIQKEKTYQIAAAEGIPCPGTFEPESYLDLKSHARDLGYPLLIKPCESHSFVEHFNVKMIRVENEADLLSTYEEVNKVGQKVMIQEIIPGDDSQGVNYNSYFAGGEPIAEFTAQKVRIEPPAFGSPRVLVSRKIPEIIEPGRSLLKKLGYEGFSCMEFKKDARDGIYKLMEINCRSNLTGSLAVKCGINFPWIMYRHLMYGEMHRRTDFAAGIYWIDMAHDLKRFLVSPKQEGYSLGQYLAPYGGNKTYATLSLTDPLPSMKRLVYFVKAACSHSLDLLSQRIPGVAGYVSKWDKIVRSKT